MLQFSEPIWLYTASAVSLPLLIHLWNLRKGKRLKIGSLFLITQSIQPTARQLRLTEWLLLLLRCLLILLLAFLLAGPWWQSNTASKDQKGWILVPQESISEIYPAFKTQIDSLMQQGLELHAFNFPFEPIKTTASDRIAKPRSYWQRMAQLNNRLPAGFPVVIFSEGTMDHFTGNRPDISLAVQWHLTNKGSRNRSLVKATGIGRDSVALKFIESETGKNIFTEQHVNVNTATPGLQFSQTDSGRFVQWQNEPRLRIDTGIMHVTVYQKSQPQDAPYLMAALEAIRPMLDRPLQVFQAKDIASIPANQDWVFWLSAEPMRSTQNGTNYFVYANGETVNSSSIVIPAEMTSAAPSSFALYKRITAQENGEMIWKDGFGRAILTKTPDKTYHFYSRFDPSWNNMVWNPAFPELIFGLLQQQYIGSGTDLRQIDTAQLSFSTRASSIKTTSPADRKDLTSVCWWLLLLFFAAERWVSLHPKTKTRAA